MKSSSFILIAVLIGGILFSFTSCSDKIDVQQTYGFELVTMPVQKKIVQGETAEIRCQLIREGEYRETKYFIRYFQPEGKGELRMDDGTVFKPNDRYPLTKETFRLYYTSHCTDQQTIDVYIEDSAGQVVQKSFSFTNDNDNSNENETEGLTVQRSVY